MTADGTRVPPGHHVALYSASTEPSVARTPGGVVVANFGCVGDEPDGELDVVLREVTEMRESVAPTFLATTAGAISELFVPAQPRTVRLESPVLWVFHHGGATSVCSDQRREDLIIGRMTALKAQGAFQVVYIVEPSSTMISAFVTRVRELGIETRHPNAHTAQTVLIEVTRPDGRILCALAGTIESFGAAAGTGDAQLLPLRSPRLARLILRLHTQPGADLSEVVQELKRRTLPLLMIVDPGTRRVAHRSFGGTAAWPVFSDLPCLQRAAREMGIAPSAQGVAAFAVPELFALAQAKQLAVAICAYRADEPIYAVIRSLGDR